MKLVLDQAAVSVLTGGPSEAKSQVRRAMRAATGLRRGVTVPTAILAELYRGAGWNQTVDAMLSREIEALELRDTDRTVARLVEAGGGIVLTGDDRDLTRLANRYRTIVVEPLRA